MPIDNTIDPNMFNFVSQQAHWLASAWITLIGLYFFGAISFWYTIPGLLLFTTVKEFWYDERYQNEITRGSSLQDFLFYMLGIIITLLCWLYHKHLHHY